MNIIHRFILIFPPNWLCSFTWNSWGFVTLLLDIFQKFWKITIYANISSISMLLYSSIPSKYNLLTVYSWVSLFCTFYILFLWLPSGKMFFNLFSDPWILSLFVSNLSLSTSWVIKFGYYIFSVLEFLVSSFL